MIESSICVVLREHASLQPNHTAFTFLDYEQDWEGVAESLTWAQLHRRSLNVALELKGCGWGAGHPPCPEGARTCSRRGNDSRSDDAYRPRCESR
jgi:hypothetical protein